MSRSEQGQHSDGEEQSGRTSLLSDVPADADEFGGHARVAEALAGLIEADNGGRTIGLEGGWGSGKSTVVRLLSENLIGDTAVFTFDAWAHEDDPLRRSFLESLIDFVKERGWLLDEEAWQEEADRLARRRRETEQHSDQHLTSNGRWITGSLFFVPVGSAFLSWALGHERLVPLQVVLAVLITLAPVLVICWLLCQARRKKSKGNTSAEDEHRVHPLSILGESSTIHQKSLTIEDHDPTSVEFEKVFKRLLSDVLTDESRRLVLVLDNLDRVGPETSGRVLSTLQTFINLGSRLPESKRVWVLLPYDRDGFKRLWGDATDQQLDKICQARFYVPSVLIADWRAYFKRSLVRSMPARPGSQIDEAVNIAISAQVDGLWPSRPDNDERARSTEGLSPSPRAMILLANDVAALELQWSDVELKHLTYYSILRRQCASADVASSLVTGAIPTSRAAPILGSDGREWLAALHFNVSVTQAKQVLLAEPASLALRQGDADRLKELAAFPGFWDVLQTLPYSEWMAGGANDLALAGYALEQSDLLDDIPTAVAGSLGSAVRSYSELWGPTTYEGGRGLASLVSLPSIKVDPDSILSRFDLLGGDDDGRAGREGRVGALVGFVEVLDAASVKFPGVPVEANAEDFVELCAVVGRVDAGRTVARLLEPTAAPNEVALVVASWAGSAPGQPRSLGTLDALLAGSALQGAHHQVTEAFVAYLQGVPGDANPQIQFAIQILFRLRSYSRDSMMPIASDGTLLDVFHGLHTADESGRAAEAAVLYVLLLPDVPEPPMRGNSTAGAALLRDVLNGQGSPSDQVGEAFTRLAVADDAAVAYSIAKSVSVVPSVVADAIRSVLAETGAPADRLVNDWETISDLATRDELARLVMANGSELARRIALSALPAQLERVLLETALEQSEVDWAVSVVNLFKARLESMSQEKWTTALVDGDHEMDLLNLLVRGGARPSFAAEFQEALIRFCELLVEGEASQVDVRYEKLPDHLSADHHREAVADKVTGLIIDHGADLPAVVLTMFGPLLQSSPNLLEHPKLVSDLVADSVRGKNAPVIAWCTELLSQQPVLVKQHRSDVENLRDLVRASLEDNPISELAGLAVAIGVEVPEVAEADNS